MEENKRILIFSTHPDDACISFGGLIYREVKLGHEVFVHTLTMGGPCSNVDSTQRHIEDVNALLKLGVDADHYSYSGVDMDGKLSLIPNTEITSLMDKMINGIKPHEVYCTPDSEHVDHKATVTAFKASARLRSGWQPRLWCIGTYMFSQQLNSDFGSGSGYMIQPLTEEDFNMKCEAFKEYKSQFKPSPNPLGIDGLRIMAEYYGMLCGHKYAEMYYQLKYIREI